VCRLCEHKHFSTEPHVFDKEPKPDKKPVTKKKAKKKKKAAPTDAERVRAWRKKNPKRYNEYQRNYMAKRRAEAN